jgi:hypothetical protein
MEDLDSDESGESDDSDEDENEEEVPIPSSWNQYLSAAMIVNDRHDSA